MSLLHRYYDPLRVPSHRFPLHPLRLIGSLFTVVRRVGEGFPSSKHNFLHMPIPIHRRVLPHCYPSSSCVPWPSPFRSGLGTPLSIRKMVLCNDAAGFTSCYGLRICFAYGVACMFFAGLQPTDFAACCLLATGQLGLYPGWTFTSKLCLAWLGAQRKSPTLFHQ